MNGLSHGTITDDSDVWVFGGQKVYKNFFNQSKYCEQFMAADVAKHFGKSPRFFLSKVEHSAHVH
jgi:DNA excision repair protein ERCC-5